MSKQPIKFEKILALCVSGALAIFFVWLAFSEQALKTDNAQKVKKMIGDASDFFGSKELASCGSVVSQCDLSIEETSEVCSADLMYDALKKRLLNPNQFPECQDAKARLAKLCSSSCALDYDSVISVPGGIKFDIRGLGNETLDPLNKDQGCIARGRRSVVFRGTCGS
jgi:hypothetical protein